MKKKKIMQINITCGVGSTGKLSQALYEASLENGYEACFAYSTFSPAIPDAFSIETKFQNYARRGENRIFGRKQRHSDSGTNRLIRNIEREEPDLIHLHNVQQNSVNYIKLFSYLKEKQIPCVYTLHDCWSFTGGCYHFTKIGCDGYESGCMECPLMEHPDDCTMTEGQSYSLKKDLIGGNDNLQVVAVSNWLKEKACQSYMGSMKNKPITIHNGIDLSLFYPRKTAIRTELGIDEDTFAVLCVASYWTAEKGMELLLALSDVIQKHWKLVLIGEIEDRVFETHQNIICVGSIRNKEKLAEYYSMADVYLNTSIEETFGMTTAESLACGTPAVVINSTACPEVIDEDTGVCVENDVSSVFEALKIVCAKGKDYYSDSCEKRVNQLFDQRRMQRDYIQLYGRILDDE